jgi:cytochrome c peroxidase
LKNFELIYFRNVILALSVLASSGISQSYDKKEFKFPKAIPAPANNKLTPARAQLGKMLFFDPRLSGSQEMSCATCHNPLLGWSDGLPTAMGNGTQSLTRSTPSLANSAYHKFLMWDGRYHELEDQAVRPIQSPAEMNASMENIVATLNSKPGYVEAFERAYPREGISQETVVKALASFERTIVSNQTPFDAWVDGKQNAISPPAKRGFLLFVGKAQCALCHQPPFFTDDGFHNIGLRDSHDEGRYALVKVKVLQGSFKTPSLRNAFRTTPYMHNGSYRTLAEVVAHYNRGGDNKENLDPNIRPLDLTASEQQDLVDFLETLTSRPQALVLPRLPD